jgi:predicted nucleic acid-binding Zn ribbon protein
VQVPFQRNEDGDLGSFMPIYVYQVVEADGSPGEIFEVMQRLNDPPLTHHPENGKPVTQLIAAPNVVTHFTGDKISNERLGRLGFTKYEKAGGGYYEKKAGSGPDVIKG